MERSGTASENSKHLLPAGAGNTRLSGHWLILIRATWILLVAFAFVVLVVSLPQLPTTFAQAQQPCIGSACIDAKGQLSPSALQALARFGISPLIYAIFSLASVSIIPAVVWILVGIILAWRKSNDWMVLLTSFLLIDWE